MFKPDGTEPTTDDEAETGPSLPVAAKVFNSILTNADLVETIDPALIAQLHYIYSLERPEEIIRSFEELLLNYSHNIHELSEKNAQDIHELAKKNARILGHNAHLLKALENANNIASEARISADRRAMAAERAADIATKLCYQEKIEAQNIAQQLREKLDQLHKTCTTLKNQNARQAKEITRLQTELEKLQAQTTEKRVADEAVIAKLEHEQAQLKTEYTTINKALEAQIIELKKEVQLLSEQIKDSSDLGTEICPAPVTSLLSPHCPLSSYGPVLPWSLGWGKIDISWLKASPDAKPAI